MNAVGIDVSKGKSTVAVLRPFGEIVASPFDVSHSPKELSKLVTLLKTLDGDNAVFCVRMHDIIAQIAHRLRRIFSDTHDKIGRIHIYAHAAASKRI